MCEFAADGTFKMCGLSHEELTAIKHELQPEPLLDKGGHKVSRSPWGPEDEIGRLNWITPQSVAAIMSRMDGRKVFDLNVSSTSRACPPGPRLAIRPSASG